jgi:hypothetical protein
MLHGPELSFLPIGDLGREDIAEDPLPSPNQQGRPAEIAADHMGFFQESDVPPALGTMDQDFNVRFGRGTHSFIGTQMNTDLQDLKNERTGGKP